MHLYALGILQDEFYRFQLMQALHRRPVVWVSHFREVSSGSLYPIFPINLEIIGVLGDFRREWEDCWVYRLAGIPGLQGHDNHAQSIGLMVQTDTCRSWDEQQQCMGNLSVV